jgi:hypothetical protein
MQQQQQQQQQQINQITDRCPTCNQIRVTNLPITSAATSPPSFAMSNPISSAKQQQHQSIIPPLIGSNFTVVSSLTASSSLSSSSSSINSTNVNKMQHSTQNVFTDKK